jgi:hypothetical protein
MVRGLYVHRPRKIRAGGFFKRTRQVEAALAELGETLESAYGEAYIARKEDVLRRASIALDRIEIQPEDLSIN